MRRMYDENQIKEIAGAAGGKLYMHYIELHTTLAKNYNMTLYTTTKTLITKDNIADYLIAIKPYLAYTSSTGNVTFALVRKTPTGSVQIDTDTLAGIDDNIQEL